MPAPIAGVGRAALLLACVLGWSSPAHAQSQLPIPALTGHVVDQTATLTADQQSALEQKLAAFEARKGSQVAVLIVESTAPEAIEPFSLRVAEKWKIGRRKVDDGAILVVAKDDRTVRLEVGYGLEGALNDATSKRIISETILPRFGQQDFNGGIAAGVDQILRVIDGEPLPAPNDATPPAKTSGDLQSAVPVLFVLALGIGGALRAWLGKIIGSVITGGLVAVVAWFVAGVVSVAVIAGVVAVFLTLVGGGIGARGLLGFVGGGGGGVTGGGFSGGGGSFGGGGASGRW